MLVVEGAVSGTRTRDPQLGKLMLYQLSYYRIAFGKWCLQMSPCDIERDHRQTNRKRMQRYKKKIIYAREMTIFCKKNLLLSNFCCIFVAKLGNTNSKFI